mmetsp:Transcript_98443/g.234366  ORF Transcript_98443/g.234366 Transcript_98443/m.234366 type:complete len:240 (+) Transcript_98443:293-1012(+)
MQGATSACASCSTRLVRPPFSKRQCGLDKESTQVDHRLADIQYVFQLCLAFVGACRKLTMGEFAGLGTCPGSHACPRTVARSLARITAGSKEMNCWNVGLAPSSSANDSRFLAGINGFSPADTSGVGTFMEGGSGSMKSGAGSFGGGAMDLRFRGCDKSTLLWISAPIFQPSSGLDGLVERKSLPSRSFASSGCEGVESESVSYHAPESPISTESKLSAAAIGWKTSQAGAAQLFYQRS